MLARKKDEQWGLTPHNERDYCSSEERSFFESIEKPQAPSSELREVFATYGRFLKD